MNTLMRIRSIICPIILAAGIVCPHSAQATLMLYTLTANGTGALGSFGFAEQTITITATADTSQIQPNGPTFGHAGAAFSVANQPGAIISVNGQSATFTGATMTFASPAAQIWGFNDINGGGNREDIFEMSITGSLGSSYDLSTPVGPILANGSVNGMIQTGSFPTSAGYFYLSSWSTGTFQAQVVPEPGPALIVIAGGVLAVLRRKVRSAKREAEGARREA